MKWLINPHTPQYKANLHCHSTLSDGKLTPEELKEAYKAHGYSVLAITDHERPADHSDLTDENFVLLTGYEIYIRPGNKYDHYGKEIHMNLFAKDPHNAGAIAYNPDVARYTPDEEKERVVRLGRQEKRRYLPGFINRVVEDARANGFIVSYNHPYWSHEDIRDVISYRGFFSMEMCNYSSYVGNQLEYNGQLYDALLRENIRIACHSADDNHNRAPFDSKRCDSFGGFTYILADTLSYDSIFAALEQNSFYSSMGPQILEVRVEGNVASIKTSKADHIAMFFGAKDPLFCVAESDEGIFEASFEIPEQAQYIRFSVMDEKHRFADTRGYFRDEFEE